MNGKTWLTRHFGIANTTMLVILFLLVGSATTVVFDTPATTASAPIVLDESRDKFQPSPTNVTTTTTTTTTQPPIHLTQHEVNQISTPISDSDVWFKLRMCESHGDYSINTGNGYFGAYQFSTGTWNSMNTGYAFAHLAPPDVQDDAARRLQIRSGWGQWPACTRMLGLR